MPTTKNGRHQGTLSQEEESQLHDLWEKYAPRGSWWGSYFVGLEYIIGRSLGIPTDWQVGVSKKGGGVIFRDPNNPDYNYIRVMPANPNSKHESQRKPYVIRYIDGKPVDVNGNPVGSVTGKEQNKSPNIHVPVKDFKFK